MLKKYLISHPQYGNIEITRNPRARRITLRARPNILCITLPIAATGKDLERALEMYGEKLLAQQKSIKQAAIDADYRIDAPFFGFELQAHNGNHFLIKRSEKKSILLYPASANLLSEERQQWLREIVKEEMRRHAKNHLPQRLQQLATEHGLSYCNVSLRDSHTRWGSCSSRGNISLSIYLMLLPSELIDYVLMHELCHTLEMNHSEKFWQTLSRMLKCDAREMRHKLKQHKCDL